jgi:hypothetical protein
MVRFAMRHSFSGQCNRSSAAHEFCSQEYSTAKAQAVLDLFAKIEESDEGRTGLFLSFHSMRIELGCMEI